MRLALVMLAMTTLTAAAAPPELTIYRSDSRELYAPGTTPLNDGKAVIHEQRNVQLAGGRQTVILDGLPSLVESEAILVELGDAGRVLAQRVLAPGDGGMLAAHRGQRVRIERGGTVQAEGSLVAVDSSGLSVRDDRGQMIFVRDFDRLSFPEGAGASGSSVQLAVDGKAGSGIARLTYLSAGLGWRATYTAEIDENKGCRMRLRALATIANRSGRDYSGAGLQLIAGAPNFTAGGSPRPMLKMAMAAASAPEAPPEESTLGDYRSYAVGGNLELPDASVTQVPLYSEQALDCRRLLLLEFGSAWLPPKPILTPNDSDARSQPIDSRLRFTAPSSLPAGVFRTLTLGRSGALELLGESHLGDTSKGSEVDLSLGRAFDLSGARERTGFAVDRAARQLDSSWRISVRNAGERARTVTIREHPSQWRSWSLRSSSLKPSRQTADTLEFTLEVPADGSATLDYALRYRWTAADE